MKIALIRHGRTKGNLEKRYIGKTDEALCPEGIESLLKSVSGGKYPEAGCVFSSPLRRCLQTTEIIYPEKECVIVPEFSEIDFGDFEGKNFQELQDNPSYREWIKSNGTMDFPGGESREHFARRTVEGYKKVLQVLDSEKSSKTVTIICHGGTIMALLEYLGYGSYFDFQVKNGDGYIFEPGGALCSII